MNEQIMTDQENKTTKPNKVVIRSYCECACDCPKCHDSEEGNKVEDCVYCQLKWANCGEYNKEHKVYKSKKGAYWCECGNLITK